MSSYFVVDHISDERKTNGLVESYQMVPVVVEDEQGNPQQILKRLNFVHWPELPVPFVHQEWDDVLKFENIYSPDSDNGNEELASIQETAQETFDALSPEEWETLPPGVRELYYAALPEGDDDEDEEEEGEGEEVEGEEEEQ